MDQYPLPKTEDVFPNHARGEKKNHKNGYSSGVSTASSEQGLATFAYFKQTQGFQPL